MYVHLRNGSWNEIIRRSQNLDPKPHLGGCQNQGPFLGP